MIIFQDVPSDELELLIKKLDVKIVYIKSEFSIELKSYEYILRVAINAIQKEVLENLIERLSANKELENGLDNVGGYTMDYLEDNNPKTELLNLLKYLKEYLPKQRTLIKYLNETNEKTIAVFDNHDFDFAQRHIRNRKVELIVHSSLRNTDFKYKTLASYSFNGQLDFDYLYNLHNEVALVVYKQEKNLYYKCLNQRKKLIEEEIKSSDRLIISGVFYTEVKDILPDIATTLKNISCRLDEMNNKVYDSYKSECDLLLNEIEDKLIYKISCDKAVLYLEGNDTIFTMNGELQKCYQIKTGDKIRIYPKDELAENLYQVAVETEPDIFGKVEEYVLYWKQMINELKRKYNEAMLYTKLKENGLKILPVTLATYGKYHRKFPMFNNDLRAIFKVYHQDKSDAEIDTMLKPVLKSKAIHNSTMIVLGRGLKQELRLFLKEGKIGEILRKRNLNAKTLEEFVVQRMPVYTVIGKEVYYGNIETIGVQL